jgi:hypothetical protein
MTMPTGPIQMTAAEIQAVAERLRQRGTSRSLIEEITALQDDIWLAARIIRTLLRHVSPSDVFHVYGTEGEPPR